MYNPDEQRVRVDQLKAAGKVPHFEGVLGAAQILREAHIPYGVVTNATLDQLKDYRAVIVPNVLEMTAEQAAVFQQLRRAGRRAVCERAVFARPVCERGAALSAGGGAGGTIQGQAGDAR